MNVKSNIIMAPIQAKPTILLIELESCPWQTILELKRLLLKSCTSNILTQYQW